MISPSSARGNGRKKMPEVRHELLTTLKAKLVPLGVLDEFKSAGVFRQLVAADPLRPQDRRLHRLAPHPDPRRIPDRRVLSRPKPTRSRRWRRSLPKPRANWPRPSRPPAPLGGRWLRARRGREGHRRRHQEGPQGADRRPQGQRRRFRQEGTQEPHGPGQGHQGYREAYQGRQGHTQAEAGRTAAQARAQAPRADDLKTEGPRS